MPEQHHRPQHPWTRRTPFLARSEPRYPWTTLLNNLSRIFRDTFPNLYPQIQPILHSASSWA